MKEPLIIKLFQAEINLLMRMKRKLINKNMILHYNALKCQLVIIISTKFTAKHV